MPRIKADTIAEHVDQQRAAVLDAAVELFTTRGFAEVSLGDVAAKVGLARSSLYRYVPDKTHLLVEWYRRAVPDITSAWSAVTAGDDDPVVRLQRWGHAFLEWANSPEHQLVAPLMEAIPNLDAQTRAEISSLHRTMMGTVGEVLQAVGTPPEQIDGTVDLLAGLLLSAARAEQAHGVNPQVRRRLDAAVAAIIAPLDNDDE